MKIGTKAIVSLLVIVMLTISAVPVSAISNNGPVANKHIAKQLDRLQQHYDRKMELRASILGVNADELKIELKTKSFNQILKQHGFSSRQAYNIALMGKLKDELKRRGWDDSKIQTFLQKRLERKTR
ncbi:MAG: hypothetical protein ACMG55_15540 [Microcoleus sp.]